MRFARQSAIFRGPLDPGAVVSVLFLLLFFVMLCSLVYTPGLVVNYQGSGAPDSQTITITSDNTIIFAGKTNTATELGKWRDTDLKNPTNLPPFKIKVESGADPDLVKRVQTLFQVQLPIEDAANLAGTDNPTVSVQVNFRGQCFFENRQIEEPELKAELHSQAQKEKKLTLVLEADRATEIDVVMRIFRLARKAGISECVLAPRPSDVAAPLRHLQP